MLVLESGGWATLSRQVKCGTHASRCTDLPRYPKIKGAAVLYHIFHNTPVAVHKPFSCESSAYHLSQISEMSQIKNKCEQQ